MKNVVIAILANLFVVNAAFADTVIAKLQNIDEKIRTIELTDEGQLKVTRTDGVKTLKLSAHNKRDLVTNAQYLAGVETQTDVHMIVCMMMINPLYATDMYVANEQGQLDLVLSFSSCAISHYTHPKQEYMKQTAEALKTKMLVLAHQVK